MSNEPPFYYRNGLLYLLLTASIIAILVNGSSEKTSAKPNGTTIQASIWQYPVSPYVPGSYAKRTFYCCPSNPHLGEDVYAAEGTAIRAIGPGVIKLYRAADGYGELVVVVEHDLGGIYTFKNAYGKTVSTRYILSIYGHLRNSQVRGGTPTGLGVGSRVEGGTIIGYVADADHNGDGTEHLHLGIRLSNAVTAQSADPRFWFRGYENTNKVNSGMGKDFAAASSVIDALINAQPYDGAHDENTCDKIYGWAWDRTQPSRRVNVEIYDGNTLLGTTTANQYRLDLHALELGDRSGNYGFNFQTPASLKNGATHSIRVKVAGSDFNLSGTPKAFNSLCGSTPKAIMSLSGGGKTGGNNQTLNYSVQLGQKVKMTFEAATDQVAATGIRVYNWALRKLNPPGSKSQDAELSETTIPYNLPRFDEDLGAGTHVVSLEVVDEAGLRDTATATIVIEETAAARPRAVLSMSGGGQAGTTGQTLNYTVNPGGSVSMNFDAAGSQVGSGSITSYEWRSNGTLISNSPSFNFPFAAASHTINLRVVNSAGLSDTATATIIVTESTASAPTAVISMGGGGQAGGNGQTLNYQVSPGGSITMNFNGSGSQAGTGNINSYEWRSNGTVISNLPNFNFPFAVASHTITLKVTNSVGLSNTATANVTVSTVTPPSPTIGGVATTPIPPIGGQAFTFTITGTNYISNTEVFFLGPGCPNNTSCVVSGLTRTPTQLSGAAVLAAGSFTVQVRNGPGGTPSNTFSLTVSGVIPTPSISGVTTSPNPPVNGQPFNFTVTGTNFNTSNAQVFFLGPGCPTSNSCVVSAGLTRTVTQLSGAAVLAAGAFTVQARNGSGRAPSNTASLTVSNPPATPVISQLATSPNPPITGQAFTITLTGSNFAASNSTVFFSGPGCSTPCSISASGSSTQVSGQAVLAAGNFTVTLRNNTTSLSSGGVTLTVSPGTPTISGMTRSPNPPIGGQAFNFTITGTNYNTANAEVFFLGPGCSTNTSCVVSGLTRTSTQLSGAAVLAAGSFTVQVRNGSSGTPSGSLPFTVASPAPSISGVTTSPNPPINGQAFMITLTGANFAAANSTIFFSGPGCSSPCSINASGSSTQVSGQAILAAGSFTVTVRNNTTGLTSSGVSLTVSLGTPTISGMTSSPNPPVHGQSFNFTITGTNFNTSNAEVFFLGPGCPSNTSCVVSGLTRTSTQLSGAAVLAAGSFTVQVRNGPGGTPSNTSSFTVASPAPSISGLTTSPNPPVNGQAFTITLTGSNFSGTNSTISFSGPGCSTPCSINASGSSTQVSGQAVLAAGNFTVTVRNNTTGLTSSGVSLTVSPPPTPVINQLSTSPNPPIHGQAFTLTLTGSNFSGSNSTIFFSGPGCSTPCSISASGSSTQVSGQAVLAAGDFTVTVRNNSTGLTSGGRSLTVSTGAPTISGMTRSPNPPIHGQAFDFTIRGTNFNTSNAEVFFIGPGCPTSTSCVVSGLSRTTTQLSGAAVLAAGSFTMRVRNGSGGTQSNSISFSVN